jgi:hypothetical protein
MIPFNPKTFSIFDGIRRNLEMRSLLKYLESNVSNASSKLNDNLIAKRKIAIFPCSAWGEFKTWGHYPGRFRRFF